MDGGLEAGADECPEGDPSWTQEQVAPEARCVVLGLDAAGHEHVAYQLSSGRVGHATRGTSEWSLDDIDRAARGCPSLALDESGAVHVAYASDEAWALKYATNAGGAWTREVVGEVHDERVALSIGAGDAILIWRHRCRDFQTCSANHAMALTTGRRGSWETEEVLVSEYFSAYGLPGGGTRAMAVSPDGRPQLLATHHQYDQRGVGFSELLLLTMQGGAWTNSTVATVDVPWHDFRGFLALDREGEPHVAIIDGGGRLVYGRRVGQGWDLTPVDLVGRAGLRLLGFALGPSGAAHLSYRTALPASRYATNACGDWRIFDVGEDGPVGSLAVHANGRVSIAFERGESSIWLARSGR